MSYGLCHPCEDMLWEAMDSFASKEQNRPSDSIQKMTKQEIPCSREYLRGLLVSQALHKEPYSLSNTVFQESRIPAVIHSSTHWRQSRAVAGNETQASVFWMVDEQYFWTSANLSLAYYRGSLKGNENTWGRGWVGVENDQEARDTTMALLLLFNRIANMSSCWMAHTFQAPSRREFFEDS